MGILVPKAHSPGWHDLAQLTMFFAVALFLKSAMSRYQKAVERERDARASRRLS